MEDKDKYLIVIVGPTAVGKTALSIELAKSFKTEIISADSRQVYKEMEIGTAKPSQSELSQVKHHFINSHSLTEEFSAGRFEQEGMKVLNKIFENNNIAVAVGGSGLYVDALCEGFDEMPEIDMEIRDQLNDHYEKTGFEKLLEKLEILDPEYYNQVDKKNPQRIIRALEVCITTGTPYSTQRKKQKKNRDFTIIKIGLDLPREILYKRIDERMDKMISEGLFEEAKRLFPLKHLNALQTVGYSEIFEYLEDKYDKEEAIRLLKRNSRRYAKRQLTWFRRDKDTNWFLPNNSDEIKKLIQLKIK